MIKTSSQYSSGQVWANKVRNCTDVARFFFQETTHDSFCDNFNFFNDDTLDEDFRDMVCGPEEALCPQETSAWSILGKAACNVIDTVGMYVCVYFTDQ